MNSFDLSVSPTLHEPPSADPSPMSIDGAQALVERFKAMRGPLDPLQSCEGAQVQGGGATGRGGVVLGDPYRRAKPKRSTVTHTTTLTLVCGHQPDAAHVRGSCV